MADVNDAKSSTTTMDTLPPFLRKLYAMVDEPETNSVVSWSDGNNSFVVWIPYEFAANLLPKHKNLASFIRVKIHLHRCTYQIFPTNACTKTATLSHLKIQFNCLRTQPLEARAKTTNCRRRHQFQNEHQIAVYFWPKTTTQEKHQRRNKREPESKRIGNAFNSPSVSTRRVEDHKSPKETIVEAHESQDVQEKEAGMELCFSIFFN